MEDYDTTMHEDNADTPSARGDGDGANGDASHQETVPIAAHKNTVGPRDTPQAVRDATDNTALKKLLLIIDENLDTTFKMLQGAYSSHESVEETLSKWKSWARAEQMANESAQSAKKPLKGLVEGAIKIMHETKKKLDGVDVAISAVLKGSELICKQGIQQEEQRARHEEQLARFKERCDEIEQFIAKLERENTEIKAIIEMLMADRPVNPVVGPSASTKLSNECLADSKPVLTAV